MKIDVYFLEIKNRFFLITFVWSTIILVCYIFKEIVLYVLIKQGMVSMKEPFYFIFTDVAEIFYVYITLIFFISNQILFLYFCYNFLIFLSSGLFYSEYRILVFVSKISCFCFCFSVIMYHNFFFPFCWDFFLSFQYLEVIKLTPLYFESKISEYIHFYTSCYYICAFYFQILVALFLVFDFSKAKIELVQKFRKFFYYFFILFSTLITPPDIFSQLLISLCLIFSYEILVFYFIFIKK